MPAEGPPLPPSLYASIPDTLDAARTSGPAMVPLQFQGRELLLEMSPIPESASTRSDDPMEWSELHEEIDADLSDLIAEVGHSPYLSEKQAIAWYQQLENYLVGKGKSLPKGVFSEQAVDQLKQWIAKRGIASKPLRFALRVDEGSERLVQFYILYETKESIAYAHTWIDLNQSPKIDWFKVENYFRSKEDALWAWNRYTKSYTQAVLQGGPGTREPEGRPVKRTVTTKEYPKPAISPSSTEETIPGVISSIDYRIRQDVQTIDANFSGGNEAERLQFYGQLLGSADPVLQRWTKALLAAAKTDSHRRLKAALWHGRPPSPEAEAWFTQWWKEAKQHLESTNPAVVRVKDTGDSSIYELTFPTLGKADTQELIVTTVSLRVVVQDGQVVLDERLYTTWRHER